MIDPTILNSLTPAPFASGLPDANFDYFNDYGDIMVLEDGCKRYLQDSGAAVTRADARSIPTTSSSMLSTFSRNVFSIFI